MCANFLHFLDFKISQNSTLFVICTHIGTGTDVEKKYKSEKMLNLCYLKSTKMLKAHKFQGIGILTKVVFAHIKV